jgi:hypothetical protein
MIRPDLLDRTSGKGLVRIEGSLFQSYFLSHQRQARSVIEFHAYLPRPWISQSAFTIAVQAYCVVPSSSLPVVVQKLPVVSLVTTSPVQMAFACWVAWSLASLIAELLSDSVELPEPYTQTRTVIAPANMTAERTTGSTKSFLRIELSPFL